MDSQREAILEVRNLKKYFPLTKGIFASLFQRDEAKYVRAVDGVSFEIGEGDVTCLV